MAEPEPPIIGEVPFTTEERYRLRRIMKAMENISPEEMEEVKRLASGGKTMRLIGGFLAKFILFLSGAVAVFTAIKQYLFKVVP